jgi:hypothetical protein
MVRSGVVTKTQLRKWLRQAERINAKAGKLFEEVDATGIESDDLNFHALVGDLLVSSHELVNNIESRVDAGSL